MGKGIDTLVVLELLFYVSASLIPLALPLAILLSSIMTIGNLAENNELTALKSSGLSLYKILKPLTFVVIGIAFGTFYFANYVIPVANLKWHSLIYDIQNTKISAILTPGVYSKELDGYAIKVDSGTDDHFKGILIHDHTDPKVIKTIRGDEGRVYKSENGKYLFFELEHGFVTEELSPDAPSFSPNGKKHLAQSSTRPSRRSTFEKATYKIDLSGFSLKRSEDETFADKHEMLNVFQISAAIDSIIDNGNKISENFLLSLKNDHPYFQSINYKNDSLNKNIDNTKEQIIPELITFKELSPQDQLKAINATQVKLRRVNQNLDGQKAYMLSINFDINGYLIEFHRKFALTFTIIVLFFIGAPLGAIVRKGGFGAPVVIAALLFMVYFVLISVGDSLAASAVVSPLVGMWFASMVLIPIAYALMRAAANDSPVFSKDSWVRFFKRFKRKNANSLPHK